jgi:hypothetical protein
MDDMNEKKILMEQVSELSKIVDLKDEEIRELKFKLQDVKLLMHSIKKRSGEVLAKEKKAAEDLKFTKELYEVVSSSASDSIDREEKIEEREKQVQKEKENLDRREGNLKKRFLQVQYLEAKVLDMQHKVYIQSVFLGIILAVVWLRSGLIRDLKNLLRIVERFFSGVSGLCDKIGNAWMPVSVIFKFLPVLLVVLLVAGLVVGMYRYITRYLDFVSLQVSFAGALVGIIGREFMEWNSVLIVLVLEVSYLIIRSERDARDLNSPYNRIF